MPYKNKADQAAACKRHYEANKAAYVARALAFNERARAVREAWIQELKSEPCADCGQKFHHACMDFDHVRGIKVDNISTMCYAKRVSRKTIEEELAKCELVCANCHRLRTWNRRQ